MVDQVNSLGIPMEDSELNDPGTDNDAPDPLIGEAPRSGALAAVTDGPVTQESSRQAARSRYKSNSDELDSLRSQYADTAKAQSDAYAEQKKQIDAATQRLLAMQAGPTDQEALYRAAAAISAPSGGRGFNISGMNQTQADILKERREAEMQKQQLIAQYAMQGPQATIGATNARLNQLTQQERIAASQLNSAGNQQFRGQANLPFGVSQRPDGSYYVAPGAAGVWDQQAASKLFGRFTLLPQPDGSKKIVMLGGSSPQSQPVSQKPPQTPQAPPPAAPGPQAPAVGGTPQTPPNAPQQPVRSMYDDVFQPSTVLDPKYGNLTPQTKPVYVATAAQAFDPGYFSQYQWKPQHIGDDKIRVKQIEKGSDEQAAAAQGAESTIYNYGNALQSMDALNDPKLLTGPSGAKIGAFENTVRGFLGDDLTAKITNDPELKKLATQQDTDKYFLNAATTGLKAIYGSRVTNMDLQQRLKSLPSNNLLPAVTRLLAQAQAEVAQDNINKSKLWSVYLQKGGDPDPSTYNRWYEANFSPFHTSQLQANLKAAPAAQSAPAAKNPLVQYYIDLGNWKAGGQKGPAPQKPQ